MRARLICERESDVDTSFCSIVIASTGSLYFVVIASTALGVLVVIASTPLPVLVVIASTPLPVRLVGDTVRCLFLFSLSSRGQDKFKMMMGQLCK